VASLFKTFLRRFLPRQIGPQHIWNGPLKGYTIVTSWHDYPAAILGQTERPLLDWFANNVRSGETWLDIGAHYGYTAIALSRLVGSNGRAFAFEPMLSTVGYLTQTRQLNNLPQLTIVPFGLSSSPNIEIVTLPVTRGMIDSTISLKNTWKEAILVAGLDGLWPQICNGVDEIHGIKIDVQGMEIEVLRGMMVLLSQFKPKLVVEFHTGVDRTCLLDLIDQAGYPRRGTPIEPVVGEVEPFYVDNKSYAFFANSDFLKDAKCEFC
jgi:FkbM family methyltransferase